MCAVYFLFIDLLLYYFFSISNLWGGEFLLKLSPSTNTLGTYINNLTSTLVSKAMTNHDFEIMKEKKERCPFSPIQE